MHIDIHDFFDGTRTWPEFYRLINRLPRHSHFYGSLLDSESDVEELLARGEAEHFGMAGWTHDRELLSLLIEEIRSLHSTLVAVHNKGKGFPLTPMPRPVTALQRVERRQRFARHDDLVARMNAARARVNQPTQPDRG